MMIFCDRRYRVQHISLIITALIVVGICAVALGAVPARSTDMESMTEHSTVVINSLVYGILAISGALVALVLWNVKDMKSTMRANHIELKKEINKKVSIQMHNAICEKQIEMEPE
jgi:hypothetical protein